MDGHLVDLTVIQVTDPGNFLAKEVANVSRKNMSAEYRSFLEFAQQMKIHYENKHVPMLPTPPKIGVMYAGKRQSDQCWYRVNIINIYTTTRGQQAQCELVDYGNVELISTNLIRSLPKYFRDVPFQVQKYSLCDVQPLTLSFDADIIAVKRACKRWDHAAIEYFRNLVEESDNIQAKILHRDPKGRNLVKLYAKSEGQLLCVNDELCKLEYATYKTIEVPISVDTVPRVEKQGASGRDKRTIEEYLQDQKRRIKMQSEGSQSESDVDDYVSALTSSCVPETHRVRVTMPDFTSSSTDYNSVQTTHVVPQTSGARRKTTNFTSSTTDYNSVQTTHVVPQTSGARRKTTNFTSSTTDSGSDSSSKVRLVPAGRSENKATSYASRSNTTMAVHPSNIGRSAARSGGDTHLDLSDIPLPRGVKSASDTLACCIGRGYLSVGDISHSGSESEYGVLQHRQHVDLAGDLNKLCRPTQPIHLSSASDVSVEDVHQKIGRGEMLRSVRGNIPTSGDMDAVSHQHSRQMFRMEVGGSVNTEFASRTVPHDLFKLPSTSDDDCLRASRTKLGRGKVLNDAKDYMSDTGDLSLKPVRNVEKGGWMRYNVGQQLVRGQTFGRGILSTSQNDYKTKTGKLGRGQILNSSMLLSGTDSSLEVSWIPATGGLEQQDTVRSVSRDRPIGRGQHLLNFIKTVPVSVATERSEIDVEKFEDAEDGFEDSSSVERDKSKNILEESVIKEAIRARDCENQSVTIKPIGMPVSDTDVQSDSSLQTASHVSNPRLCLSLPFTKPRRPKFVQKQTLQTQTKPAEDQMTQNHSLSDQSGMEVSISKIISKETCEKSARNVRFANDVMSTHVPEKFLQLKREIEGQKLLDMIRPNNMTSRSTNLPQISRADQPTPNPFLGVIVHGISQPVPLLDFDDDLPFAENIKKAFDDDADIMFIQSYTWKPILRGRCVVGISPVNSGKTIAYLPAILTQIISSSAYLDVPPGNGPLALILVPSWKKAQNVFDLCNEVFVQRRRIPRVLSIYASGCEDGYEIALINGCEVLIATPPCLKRMIEKKYTNLNRLCHLVLDDAHILTEEFTVEIQNVMSSFSECRKQQKTHSLTTQLVVFGSQWTPGIESFTKVFLNEPLIVITSRCEAAVYGKVKQIVHMCSSAQNQAEVCGLIDEIGIAGEKIVICTSEMSQVSNLQQLLSTRSVMSLAVHHTSEQHIKDQMVQQWNTMDTSQSCVVLVTNDECLIELAIVDATAVIHFDIPNSKTKFGARLGCMTNYFQDMTAIDKKPKCPASHIIVSKDMDSLKNIQSLMKFLKRCKCNIPSQLSDLVDGMRAWQNEDKKRPLCRNLKAFGFCVNESQCQCRHLIIGEVDNVTDLSNTTLPSYGEVKVRLNHIIDANHFYMRVLEHRPPDGSTIDFSGIYLELLMAMAQYFNAKKNRKSLREVREGMLCAYDDGHNTFHRVKILEWKDETLKDKAVAKVWFVDDGKDDVISLQDLRVLPKELADYPYQAVEVFLAHVKPMDNDSEWTPKVNTFIIDELKKGTYEGDADDEWRLDGRVRLSLGNTIWLDPLVKRSVLEGINVVTNKCNVRKDLIKNRLAADNPVHIENLYKLCENIIDLPDDYTKKGLEGESQDALIDTEVLPKDTEYHDVIVSAVVSPDMFYVQRQQTSVQLNDMLDEINKKIENSTLRIPLDVTLTSGSLCLAQFSQDDRWYRGKITEVVDAGFKVDFFDYGDRETVERTRVKLMPDEYARLPCQAIECRLDGLKPKGDVWDDTAGNALWDMAHFITNEKRFLVAKVISESPSTFSDSQKYTILLYDTTSHDDISLAQELVRKGYAHCDTAGGLGDLFSRPVITSRKLYQSCLHKIEDLCALIYWSQDDNPELSVSKSVDVQRIITECITSARFGDSLVESVMLLCLSETIFIIKRFGRFGDSLVESGAVSCLCSLIGYLTNVQAHHNIIHSLVQAVLHSESVCQACLADGICTSLLRCIEQGMIPEIQQQACRALCELTVSESFRSAFGESGPTCTLCDYIDSTDNIEIQTSVYQVLIALLQGSQSVSSEVKSSGICQKAATLLASAKNHELGEALLSFFAAVAAWENCHSELKRRSVLEGVIDKMSKSDCCQCIYQCALFCQFLSQASRKNKTLLLEYKVVVVLNRLLNQSLDRKTRGLCQELESSLAIRLPEQQVIMSNHFVDTGHARSTPTVTWVQNTFKIVLTINVSGAQKEDFSVTDDTVHFRNSSNGIEQQFDYELFGKIIPQKTGMSVRSSQVKLSLRKVEKGKWSRLTKHKQKNTNLSVDFEKIVDSSENEVSDEEDPFGLVKEKHKLPVPQPGQSIRKDHLDLPIYSDSDSESLLSLSNEDQLGEDLLDLG